MGKTPDQYTDATTAQIERLRALAIRDLKEHGYIDPSERAIHSRLNTLAEKEGLKLPGPPARGRTVPRLASTFSSGLGRLQRFFQRQAYKASDRIRQKRKGKAHQRRDNEIPYYFTPIPDDYVDHFARYLPATVTVVLLVLWRYAKPHMQTWISLRTICEKSGVSRNTVRMALRLLGECKIVIRENAGGKDFGGKVIKKEQGDKYRLNWPAAWDRKKAKELEGRNRRGDKPVDK